MTSEPGSEAALRAVADALRLLEQAVPADGQAAFHDALARIERSLDGEGSPPPREEPQTSVEPPALPVAQPPSAEELVAGLTAYQVDGQPWWKSRQSTVLVQYGDLAQLELEEKVVGAYGWRRGELQEGLRTRRQPGRFDLSFSFTGKRPKSDLEVLWTREPL